MTSTGVSVFVFAVVVAGASALARAARAARSARSTRTSPGGSPSLSACDSAADAADAEDVVAITGSPAVPVLSGRLVSGGGSARHTGSRALTPWRSGRSWLEQRVAMVVASADLHIDPSAVVGRGVPAVALAMALAGARWGVGGVVVTVGLVVAVPPSVLAWHRGREAQRFSAGLPALLEAIAGKLRAGASLPAALASSAGDGTGSGRLDADLAALAQRVAHGQPFVAAVDTWVDRRPGSDVGLVAAALVLGTEAGGARARALDGVATTLRDRRAIAAEVNALSSQARASAVVMMGAPVVFAALGLLSDPEVSTFLLRTPAGLGCLVAGLALDAAAGVWMVRIAGSTR